MVTFLTMRAGVASRISVGRSRTFLGPYAAIRALACALLGFAGLLGLAPENSWTSGRVQAVADQLTISPAPWDSKGTVWRVSSPMTPDEDLSPVRDCDALPDGSSIEVFTRSDTARVCRQLLRVLEGVTVADLRTFQKAAYVLSIKGYRTGHYPKSCRCWSK